MQITRGACVQYIYTGKFLEKGGLLRDLRELLRWMEPLEAVALLKHYTVTASPLKPLRK